MSFEMYNKIENELKQYLPNDIVKYCIMPIVFEDFREVWQKEHSDKMFDLHKQIDPIIFEYPLEEYSVHERIYHMNYEYAYDKAKEYLATQPEPENRISELSLRLRASKLRKKLHPQWEPEPEEKYFNIQWLQYQIESLT
jgi:hypothetical protein